MVRLSLPERLPDIANRDEIEGWEVEIARPWGTPDGELITARMDGDVPLRPQTT